MRSIYNKIISIPFFKRKNKNIHTLQSKFLEKIIDKETGLIPEVYLRDIILEYHFDKKKFIDKFLEMNLYQQKIYHY